VALMVSINGRPYCLIYVSRLMVGNSGSEPQLQLTARGLLFSCLDSVINSVLPVEMTYVLADVTAGL